jgi:hypothetical protein
MVVRMAVLNVSRAIWLAGAIFGCSRSNETSSAKVADAWHRGDVAVVESTAADFFESQVLDVSGGRLRVQRTQGGESLQVGVGDAYRIPTKALRLAPGAWAICQVRIHEWVACRVRQSGSIGAGGVGEAAATKDAFSEYDVVDALGNEQHLKGVGVLIEPTGLTAMNIQRRFEQSSRRANFERSFQEAGRLRRPSGWQPAPRRLVLASRQGQWFGAQIVELDDDRVVVRWDGQKDVTDLPKDDVAPQPPACGPSVRGDRALRRPPGHGAAWSQVVVVAVDGADVTVEDVDRTRSSLQMRDICPFGGPASTPN